MRSVKDRPRVQINELSANDIHKTAVQYCEDRYPKTCSEFKRIQQEQYVLFCKKQRNYGSSNISVGTNLESSDDVKLSLTGLWFRINDKIQRLKQLIVLGQRDEVGEAETDTFQDLSIYGVIAQLVSTKVWGK
jgi:curved DNA-binding protein CbpA